MFKKKIALLIVAAIFISSILIPSVQSAAESALSIFRVADTKTITITVSDIQDIINSIKNNSALTKPEAGTNKADTNSKDNIKSQVKTLSSLRDFTAFEFNLPTSLKSETPKLFAVDAQSKSLTLDTTKINAELQKLDATATVDNSYNGTTITVNTPAAIAAQYQDVTLVATQNVYIDAPDTVINSLWSALLSIPAIPDDLRTQLAEIDPQTRDIYLPVIEGLGRETDLGSNTGYIYSSSDLSQVIAMIPGLSDNKMSTELKNENTSALIWAKNGVLYCLVGQKTDSELSQIARSIH